MTFLVYFAQIPRTMLDRKEGEPVQDLQGKYISVGRDKGAGKTRLHVYNSCRGLQCAFRGACQALVICNVAIIARKNDHNMKIYTTF